MRATLCLLLHVTIAPAQSELSNNGYDMFRRLLLYHGLEPCTPLMLGTAPRTSFDRMALVILGPPPTMHRNELAELSRTLLLNGGAVLIATDAPCDLRDFLPPPAYAQVDGRTVIRAGGRNCFNNYDDMPYLRFEGYSRPPYPDLAAITLLKNVATNRPSYLSILRNNPVLRPMAGFGDPDSSRQYTAMAYTADGCAGVLLSDAGPLSNQFLRAPDPRAERPLQNTQFAIHLASFLARGPDGTAKRDRCIVYENGYWREDFDKVVFPTPESYTPPWPVIQRTLATIVEEKIDQLQNQDVPTRPLRRLLDRISTRRSAEEWIAYALLIVAGIWLFRAVLGHRRGNPPEPKPGMLPKPGLAASMQVAGNYYPAMRDRLREAFEKWGVPIGNPMPGIAVRGGFLYRMRMRNRMRRLRRLADESRPTRVTLRGWKRIEREIRSIEVLLQSGEISFAKPEARA